MHRVGLKRSATHRPTWPASARVCCRHRRWIALRFKSTLWAGAAWFGCVVGVCPSGRYRVGLKRSATHRPTWPASARVCCRHRRWIALRFKSTLWAGAAWFGCGVGVCPSGRYRVGLKRSATHRPTWPARARVCCRHRRWIALRFKSTLWAGAAWFGCGVGVRQSGRYRVGLKRSATHRPTWPASARVCCRHRRWIALRFKSTLWAGAAWFGCGVGVCRSGRYGVGLKRSAAHRPTWPASARVCCRHRRWVAGRFKSCALQIRSMRRHPMRQSWGGVPSPPGCHAVGQWL